MNSSVSNLVTEFCFSGKQLNGSAMKHNTCGVRGAYFQGVFGVIYNDGLIVNVVGVVKKLQVLLDEEVLKLDANADLLKYRKCES